MSRRLALIIVVCAVACNRGAQYSGVGDVVALAPERHSVTVRHDGIAGLMAPATTELTLRAATIPAGVAPGVRVRFEVVREGSTLIATRLAPLAEGLPGVHDHTPHHGGIVAMAGMIHLEALATPDGRVRVYLTDVWRRPLPLSGIRGSVTLRLADGKRTLPLIDAGDALEARAPGLTRPDVNARFELTREGEPIDMSFQLPTVVGASGAAGISAEGCVAPAPQRSDTRSPRCTLRFAGAVSAVAATPNGQAAVIGVVGLGATLWRMPAGTLLVGFEPPPPVTAPVSEPPHLESANAIAVSPDSGAAVIAYEGRLVRYDLSTGRLVEALAGPGSAIRAVSWAPDGTNLLVVAFYDPAAHLMGAAAGNEIRRFPVEREAAAATFAADGRRVAVASELGPVTLFDAGTGSRERLLGGISRPTQALAFAGPHLLSTGDDGALRIWDAATGVLEHAEPAGPALNALAVASGDGIAAAAGVDGTIRLYDLSRGDVVESMPWHRAPVLAMAWAGSVLISGDAAGRVALWDLAQRTGGNALRAGN